MRMRLLIAIALISLAGAVPARAQSTQAAFFDDSVLQEVRIAISSRDWAALKEHFEDDTYYSADITWNGVTVRNVGIRSRGAATRNGSKPGLRVDVNRFITNQEFLGLKAFSLDNSYSDTSLVRESLAMKMFAKMGIPASREAHARLFVNNEYVGAYVIVEAVDRTFIGRVFGALEGNVESGGYLYEFQHEFAYYFDYLGPSLAAYAPLFKPQTRDTDSIANIYGPLEEMIRTINDSTDEDFAAAVGGYIDLRQFLRHLAVETFVVEGDGIAGFVGLNNFYLYRFRSGAPARFIPKDKDAAFGSPDSPITLRFESDVLIRRAMQVPELRQIYFDALLECATFAEEPDADGRFWLEREVERETSQIASAVAEDPVYPSTFDAFQDVVASLIEFTHVRPGFVRAQVAAMLDAIDSARRTP